MKKILILLAALLYIFAAEAQTKISQDSIESIQGQKVGRLRPVVSNGFYQKSSEGGDSYNQVLDTETGVPIESIATGQEALDTLSVMISQTDKSLNRDFEALNNTFGTYYIGGTLGYESTTNNSALTDGVIQWIACDIQVDAVAIGVEIVNASGTSGSFTGDNFNGVALYSYDSGTITKIATTSNNEDIWKVAAAEKDTFLFTTEVDVSVGVYWIGLVYNDAGTGTAPQLMRQYRSQADFNYNNTDYFNSYSSGATLPSTFDISTATKSNSSYQIKIIGKGHLE